MKRKLAIVLAVVVAALVAWGLARALPLSDEEERRMRSMNVFITAGVPERLEDPEKLPNWRAISDDLGVLLRQDERFGYRGRLFVKAGDTWEAVAIDGIDSFGYVPLKR